VLCSELVDTLGFALTPVASCDPLDEATEIATLPLSLASEQAEISIAVGVDRASAAALAEAMLGSAEVEPEAVKDMMRELANVAGGAFKRMAVTEGRTLTTGLPSETSARAFRQTSAVARKQWVGTVEGSPIAIRFELELRARGSKRVNVASLREGMVIAADLRNPLGALLIPCGTRITESRLGGLRRALGAEVCVDVLETP
jgi:hypothetical protein